nr:spore wall protein 1-like [Setaria viridis]
MTDDDQTARNLWLAIEGLFHTNKQSRAIFLSHDFHSMMQGDSSIAEYCQRMKTLADALCDVSHPVQDSQLVLDLLRGLNPLFSNIADDIANSTTGFPSFAQAHDMLALKELRLTNGEKISNSTVLLVGNSSSSSSSDCTGGCHPLSGSAQTGGGGSSSSSDGSRGHGGSSGGSGGKKKWQKKNGGGSFQVPPGGGGSHGGRPPRPTGPWFCFSPGAGSYDATGFQQAGS